MVFTALSVQVLNHLDRELTEWISGYAEDFRAEPGAKPFVDLIKAARRQWWPSLRLLQTACSTPPVDDALPRLLSLWSDLGRAAGLDPKKERMRHERDARSHCSWIDCRYHVEGAPDVLLICKGCGDARYCGRECQRMYVFFPECLTLR